MKKEELNKRFLEKDIKSNMKKEELNKRWMNCENEGKMSTKRKKLAKNKMSMSIRRSSQIKTHFYWV